MICDENELIKLYNKKLTYVEISKKLNISTSCIGNYVRRLADKGILELRKPGNFKTLKEKEDLKRIAKKYHEKGLNCREIANKMQISYQRVHNYLSEMGLEIKRARKRKEQFIEVDIDIENYNPPKLKIGKNYFFRELNDNFQIRRMDNSFNLKGKVIKEYKDFYKIKTKNYISCINKNNMMYLDIKELK